MVNLYHPLNKMILSIGPVLTAAIFLSYIASAQDNSFRSFRRFIDTRRFSINRKRPVIPTRTTRPPLGFKPNVTPPWQKFVLGNPADVGEYPFMVFIELNNGEDQCGGTLLSNSWVLTAAHCLNRYTPTKILIGAHTNDGLDRNAVTRTMQRKCSHKDFNPQTLANDISLIKLSTPVIYGTYIKKVKLPPANSKALDGSTGIAMGWGFNEHLQLLAVLQEGEVVVVNKAQCASWYSQQSSTIPDHHFCAGLGGADTCGGDSGGPMVIKENLHFVLRGITSFGPEDCGQAERPGVYTRVSSYIGWINRKMHRPCREYTWGPWLPTCSVTCGTGTETSTRECRDEDGVATSSTNCPGLPTKTGTCTRPPCKEYRWGTWQKTCHVTCGTGVEQRRRNCLDELDTIVSMSFCSPGQSEEIGTCHLPPCPTYRWSAWTTTCSVTCGMGTETKRRQCLDQNGQNVPARFCSPGDDVELGSCTKAPCDVYEWGAWKGSCSVTCGTGVQTRTRQCLDQNRNPVSDALCGPGTTSENGACHNPLCKSYTWSPWITTCSVTCGSGTETKRRQCEDHNGKTVAASLCSPGGGVEYGSCLKAPCNVYEWGPWKVSCSVNCGTGVQTRTRQCLDQNRNLVSEGFCGPGASTEHGTCHKPSCKSNVNNARYSWSPWITTCSVTCGTGSETKRRQCVNHNGKTVSASLCSPGGGVEYGSCMKAPCNVYGWGPWKGSCSVTCGTGVQTRTRQCLDQNRNPVPEALCGSGTTSENGACHNPPCKSYNWSPWISTCSVTCGSGTVTKRRQCEDHNGKTVAASFCSPGGGVEYGSCMKAPCNGALLQAYRWSAWTTTCSVTCGSGTETKRRQCVDLNEKTAAASLCSPGEGVDYGSCMKAPCNIYEWGPWKVSCSLTCGTGVQTRTRQCLDQNRNPVSEGFCGPGRSTEHGNCHKPSCKSNVNNARYSWSPWITTCSVTCGSGSETKRRQCVDHNGKTVAASLCSPGGGVEYGSCMKAPCNVLQRFHWAPWRKHCSVTCGDGMELNFRQCLDSNGLGVASINCSPGNEVERRKCSLSPCSTGYDWGPWKVTCSVSCGRGSEVKARQCVNHKREYVNVRNCKGISLETGNCVKPPCPSDSPFQWGPWKTWSRCHINTLTTNRCAGFQSTTRDCLHMGRDADPYRCISTIGGDYYREATCNMYGC